MVHFTPEDGKPVILFRLCPNQKYMAVEVGWGWEDGGEG